MDIGNTRPPTGKQEGGSDNNDNLSAIDRQLAELDLLEEPSEFNESGNDNNNGDESENVKVMVRCRPILERTEGRSGSGEGNPNGARNNVGVVQVNEKERFVAIGERRFQFDAVFGPKSDNGQVYMKSVRQSVEFAFKGYNCTVFLYGQTGTGKTYTHSSLTLSSFAHLFSLIGDSNSAARFLIRASYYELYNEDIRDLLSNSSTSKTLELRESKTRGVYVKDLTCYLVNNLTELEKLKRLGDKQRTTAATRMNEHSSRSHSIFSITIETVEDGRPPTTVQAAPATGSNKRQQQPNRAATTKASAPVRVGRVLLFDLAGSERQSKSGSTGARLKEASRINLSLTCLSLVIRALTDSNSTHVPYRNSKLTRLLSGSLGGNSKTLLIACVSPARTNLDETLNTLRFASRTKRIKNKAIINEDAKDALLRKYRRQIEELRLKLREHQQRQQQALGTADGDEDEAIESLVASAVAAEASTEANTGVEAGGQQMRGGEQQVAGASELLQQLRLLRGKIMVGGENLLEKAEMHERLLEASRSELEEKRLEELRLKERLERKRATIEKMAQTKGSLENQAIYLDEKLKRVLLLYRQTKEEQRDLASEHQQLKESLLQTIRATSKEIRYADCIIEDFIPREYSDLINAYAQYDDESDEWQIKYIALSGNNMAQTKRMTEGQTTAIASSVSASQSNRAVPYIRLKDLSK